VSNWSTKINVRTVSANPIVKIINFIVGIIEFLSGIRRSGMLTEEKDCLVVDTKTKVFWFLLKSEDILKIAKTRISGIKVSTVKSWIFFRSTVVEVYASGVSDRVAYEVKLPYKDIKEKAESWLK
jgi:hypothetical protein